MKLGARKPGNRGKTPNGDHEGNQKGRTRRGQAEKDPSKVLRAMTRRLWGLALPSGKEHAEGGFFETEVTLLRKILSPQKGHAGGRTFGRSRGSKPKERKKRHAKPGIEEQAGTQPQGTRGKQSTPHPEKKKKPRPRSVAFNASERRKAKTTSIDEEVTGEGSNLQAGA